MSTKAARRFSFLVVVILFVASLASPKTYASPKAKVAVVCESARQLKNRVPVLMVHGWRGDPTMWGEDNEEGSMRETLDKMTTSNPVKPFSYTTNNLFDWVDHPAIGDKLAATIKCLSDASKQGGGPGKVIVVAHSMGGLATRLASAQVGDRLAGVITLGTPRLGSGNASLGENLTAFFCTGYFNPKANICIPPSIDGLSERSKRLKALPAWPPQVPVKTIAGRITYVDLAIPTPFGNIQLLSDAGGDGVVGVESALEGAQGTDRGGGPKEFRCQASPLGPPPSCEHGNIVNSKPIQQEIVQTIKRFIANVAPVEADTVSLGGLTIPLKPGWKAKDQQYGGIKVTTNACRQVNGVRTCSSWTIQDKAADPGTLKFCGGAFSLVASRRTIGGKPVKYYSTKCHDGARGEKYELWFVPGKKLLVSAFGMKNLQAQLNQASWQ